jgi:hypothetical protein
MGSLRLMTRIHSNRYPPLRNPDGKPRAKMDSDARTEALSPPPVAMGARHPSICTTQWSSKLVVTSRFRIRHQPRRDHSSARVSSQGREEGSGQWRRRKEVVSGGGRGGRRRRGAPSRGPAPPLLHGQAGRHGTARRHAQRMHC